MEEEVEVEVIEPKSNWEKELPMQAEVVTTQVPIQRIIVNGQEKVAMGDACVLMCPRCRLVIQQFQPGIPEVEVYKALCTDKDEELNKTIYCQKCGQKLRVLRPMPVEGTYDVQESAE
jgi:hypothetical protein